MSQNDFTQNLRTHFDKLSNALFSKLSSNEDLILNLRAEDGLFVRFNGNRVRQNTDIQLISLSLQFQSGGKSTTRSRTLSGDYSHDFNWALDLLRQCRKDCEFLPLDPHQVPIENNGESSESFSGKLPKCDQLIDSVTTSAEGSDLAGLYCGGIVISANRNSKGQSHWFATEKFFLDYSLYSGSKAAKSVYAGREWKNESWIKNLSNARNQLALLDRPSKEIKPGKYRTYLAPGATSELFSMLSWGALSASAWKQGRCALRKLADGEAKLSPLFTLKENFSLGLTPRFNSRGEIAPENLTLIENGQLKAMLTSSRTSKEYGLESNSANDYESIRALDVMPGNLEEKEILKELGTGLYLSNLHYLNWSDLIAARITGMTRYACFWVEQGEIVGPIKDLRFDENLYDALGEKLISISKDAEIDPSVDTYYHQPLGGKRTPGILVDQFTFTL